MPLTPSPLLAGLFTVALDVAHFFFPVLLDLAGATAALA